MKTTLLCGLLLVAAAGWCVSGQIVIGNFTRRQHRVNGQLVALSERVLEIRDFQYDGTAPAAFFWADTNSRPSRRGYVLQDGAPFSTCGEDDLPKADGTETHRVEFPEGTSLLDILGGSISVWCEAFDANFGEVVIPDTLDGLPATANGPLLECSENPPAVIPDIAQTPEGYNCEPLNEQYQVRWQVQGDQLAVELVSSVDDGAYMAFGISGNETRTFMVGADAVVADLFNGEFRARDFYLSGRSPCAGANGVCPDPDSAFTNDVSSVSGSQDSDLTLVRYTRPLNPTDLAGDVGGQRVDRAIITDPGVLTFIVWALGPVNQQSGLPEFHSIAYPRNVDVSIEFGRQVADNCEPLVGGTPPPPPPPPPPPGIPEIAQTPEGFNCEALNEDYQVRWQIQGDQLAVELVGLIDDDVYMGFGISGRDAETFMVGADAVVADAFNGEFRAKDFFMNARAQCSLADGVCPDPDGSFTNDVSSISGLQDSGVTLVRYTRPLVPTDLEGEVGGERVDRAISTDPGVSTFIVWALGPIDPLSGLPFFHSIAYPRNVDVSIEFGRDVQDNCPPLVGGPENPGTDPPTLPPFRRMPIVGETELVAHIGNSGSVRGVEGITGRTAWGIAWYINDLLIPVIEARRGTTYTFRVNGGDDPEARSQYHPLYITDSIDGGYLQQEPEVRLNETVFAGLTITNETDEGFEVLAAGPLCEYTVTDDTPQAALTGSYDEFFETLDTTCASNTTITDAGAVLEFTPDENTPDLLYYQCVTHRNLGWKIRVIDADAESILQVDCSNLRNNTIQLRNDVTLSAIIDPVAETLTAELIYDGIGWIAMGFTAGGVVMVGSEAVIGLPDEPNGPTNPGKYNLNAQSVAGVQLMPESQQTLINATIEQTETQTIMRFTKLLVEPGEHPISATEENTFLFAYGGDNELAQHAVRGGFDATLSQCAVLVDGVLQNPEFILEPMVIIDDDDQRSLWVAHGVCASLAWAILVPLAVGSSIIRKTLESFGLPKSSWFQLHRGLNTLAAALTIVAFSLAVHAINQRPDPEHFSLLTHHKVGLAIFILTFFQALGGILRPHLPKPVEMKEHDEEENNATMSELVPEEKSCQRTSWEIGHRVLGVALIGMAWWQVQDGLGLFADLFDEDEKTAAFWAVVGGICGFFFLVFLYEKLVMGKKEYICFKMR